MKKIIPIAFLVLAAACNPNSTEQTAISENAEQIDLEKELQSMPWRSAGYLHMDTFHFSNTAKNDSDFVYKFNANHSFHCITPLALAEEMFDAHGSPIVNNHIDSCCRYEVKNNVVKVTYHSHGKEKEEVMFYSIKNSEPGKGFDLVKTTETEFK